MFAAGAADFGCEADNVLQFKENGRFEALYICHCNAEGLNDANLYKSPEFASCNPNLGPLHE